MRVDKEYSEKKCMEGFLKASRRDEEDWKISKPAEDELVDIIAENKSSGEVIKAQVRFLEDKVISELGSGKVSVGSRGPEKIAELIVHAIRAKQKYPSSSTANLYLLLYAAIEIPDFWEARVLRSLPDDVSTHYKAIYIVFFFDGRILRVK